MFTAIVLVCLSGAVEEPNSCYTYTNERISQTEAECMDDIARGLNLGVFSYSNPDAGEYWEPVNYYCVNWSAERV